MDITIERYDPALHDVETVARLIYQADPSLMRFVFGEEAEAAPTIAKLVQMEHNDYSWHRLICALYENEVVGVIAGIAGAEKREVAKENGKEWGAALGVRGMLRALRYGSRLAEVSTTELADDEFYISALTVDDRYRGKGIGTRLLAEVFREHDKVVTDVNITKDDSLRFYQRNGFVIRKKMTFIHKGEELGNYQIRRG